MKVDKVVSKETKYIALGTMLLSVLMEAIFLIIGRWDYTVLLGNLLGASTAVFNFFLMGLAVQKAVEMDEEEAKKKMKTSLTIRTQMILIVALLGGVVPVFNIFAVIIPYFFPRIIISIRGLALNKEQNDGGKQSEQ